MHFYTIGGFCFASEIRLPAEPSPCSDVPDVLVRVVAERPQLASAIARGKQWAIGEQSCLIWELDRLALKVSEGCRIDIWVEEPIWLQRARTYLTGAALAALAMERRVTPYHGSAVSKDGMATMILAPSGTGKSTFATALCMQGHVALADDVCLPRRAPKGWELPPVITAPKVRSGAAAHWDLDILSEEADDEVRIRPSGPARTVPIESILLIERSADGGSVSKLDGGRAAKAVMSQVYRAENVKFWQALGWCLMDVTSLVSQAAVYRVCLPDTLDQLQQFAARARRHGWAEIAGAIPDKAVP